MKKIVDSIRTERIWRSIGIGSVVGLIFVIAFFAGFFARSHFNWAETSILAESDQQQRFSILIEVDDLLNNYYLRELPSSVELEYAAIRGMLAGLGDRNTFFIDPPVAQSESDVLAGTYGGIGVSVRRDEQSHLIVAPFPGSPAELAGILEGDILISVNDVLLEDTISVDSVDQMLRGEVKENNGITVEVERSGTRISMFILFDVINIPSILWRVSGTDERIGIIQVLRFTNRTPDELYSALDSLNGRDTKGLILDLRNNSGGLLQESIQVASQFLENGQHVFYQITNHDEKVFAAESDQPMVDLPIVVLVNSGTASAAELLAGALQDHSRGILVGQQTFGKGTIQQIFPLRDSSSVHITSAEWVTPNRHKLDGVGLSPDIPVIPDPNGRDIELGIAEEYLHGLLETNN